MRSADPIAPLAAEPAPHTSRRNPCKRALTLALPLALLCTTAAAQADDAPPASFVEQRDRFMAQRNGVVGVLGAWSAVSVLGGALLTLDPPWMPQVAATRVERRAFGIATLSFALVNSVFAIVGASQTSSLRSSLTDIPSLVHERHVGGSFFAVNAGLDMLYISAGALLFQSATPMLRGFGAGVLSQGGFLIGFDTSSALIYRHGGR